jgi:phosphatidate cytidylyltransferase
MGTVGILLEPIFWAWAFPEHPQKVGSKGSVWTVIGVLYIGWLLAHLVALRGFDDGRNWIFLALFVTFAYDTVAYFTGRSLGRHKMSPRLSPGKTWEGAAGGLAGAILMSLFFTLSTPLSLPITWVHAVILGVLISVFGQIGDLAESALKRYTGVKDAGKIVPGHGGILDRLDSVVFTGAVVYYYVIWVIQ